MLKNVREKRIVFITLIVILLFQVVISVYYGSKKSSLFLDEVFSYTSANHWGGVSVKFPQEEWTDEEWYNDYMTVDIDHRFDYSIPYKNQITDVHPPFFYFFLYTSSSFIPGRFSYWAGIGWNILFFMGCTIVLYFLCKELFQSRQSGIISAFLFSISYGGLNTMVFIRMYMLMTFILLLHMFVYVRYMELEKIPVKAYVFLMLTLVAGAMTQYYFLIAAFFGGVWYTIKYLQQKRYLELTRYLATIVFSAVASLVIFPTMWNHIFYGGRGREAQANFLSGEGYFSKLKIMFQNLDRQMFEKMFFPILGGLIVLFVLCCLKEKRLYKYINKKVYFIGFVCIGYFLLVTKVAPYQIDRYVMPIYPLVHLIVTGCAYKLLSKFISTKWAFVLCIMGFGGLTGIDLLYCEVSYTYENTTAERRAVAEEYRDSYVVYIGEEKPIHYYYDIMQILKEYKGFYYIADIDNKVKIKSDMKILNEEKEVIIYVDHAQSLEEMEDFLQTILSDFSIERALMLNDDWEWSVYLLEKN